LIKAFKIVLKDIKMQALELLSSRPKYSNLKNL